MSESWNPSLDNKIYSFLSRKDRQFPDLNLLEKIERREAREQAKTWRKARFHGHHRYTINAA